MSKWKDFTPETIDSAVLPNRIGVYVLACHPTEESERFWVGRSDNDLQSLLHDRLRILEEEFEDGPKFFMFDYMNTVEEAYAKACSVFHRHKAKIPHRHPRAPTDSTGKKLSCSDPTCEHHFAETTEGSGSS